MTDRMTDRELADISAGMARFIEMQFDGRSADAYTTHVCSSVAAYFYCEAAILERDRKRWVDHMTNACVKVCRGEA